MNLFPSPIGELHFSMRSRFYVISQLITISVPYRGATFLNAFYKSYNAKIAELISVPYRGATFLNNHNLCCRP